MSICRLIPAARIAVTALAILVFSAVAPPARAASSYDLCLGLNGDGYGQYFMTFLAQGNTILVGGEKGHGGQDDHGPLFGTLSQIPGAQQAMELGVTVTFANAGDYANQNTENVVFTFLQSGDITYKRWLHAQNVFTQGTASVIICH